MRRVAPVTVQPAGSAGSAKRTSARAFPPDFVSTFRTESLPKMLLGALCSTQVSRSADAVFVAAQLEAWTVQKWLAGLASTLPLASVARTRKLCAPGWRNVYSFGDVHATYAAPSSEHSNLEPCSLDDKPKLAVEL